MSPRAEARVGAIVVVGLLLALGDYFIHASHHAQGKAAFLAAQAQRFDRMYSGEYRVGSSLVFALVTALVVLGVYELVAAGLFALLQHRKGPTDGGA